MHPFFLYLFEASTGLAAFAIIYRLFLYRLTHFQWNRGYLLGSLLLSLTLPLFPQPQLFSESSWMTSSAGFMIKLNLEPLITTGSPASNSLHAIEEQSAGAANSFYTIAYVLLALYLAGLLNKVGRFLQNLRAVYLLVRQGKITKEGKYYLVHSQQQSATFSFLHYIFLQADSNKLSAGELAQLLQHEQTHADQKHTLDLLLFEIAAAFLWFNPAIYYLGARLREVHEYQVDATVSRSSGSIRKYGELLIKLASQPPVSPLLNTFSSKQIFHRIHMLTQTKSSPMQKLRFLTIVPAVALTLIMSSFLGSNDQQAATPANSSQNSNPITSQQGITVRKISWEGNTAYTDEQLSKALKLKAGDPYQKEDINSLLNYNPDGTDISSLYMDNGYLFFQLTPKETFEGNTVDLEFNINEGPQAKIGAIRIEGNTKISTADLLEKMNIKKGELFSRSKLIAAQKAIINTGYFNPEKVGINPIPNIEAGTVDIEFVLEEIR